jgi:hypothetical protein
LKRKTHDDDDDDDDTPGSTGTLAKSRLKHVALRRKQWERMERS